MFTLLLPLTLALCPQFAPDGLVQINNTSGGFGGGLSSGDRFGRAVTSLGDLDGDGIDDLAVCAKRDDDGGTDTGSVYILFLNQDGTVKSDTKISNGNGGLPAGTCSDYDYFGYSLTRLDDLDGDGVQELAVGAPGSDRGVVDGGAVHILFLNRSGQVKNLTTLSAQSGVPNPPAIGNYFGQATTAAGDWDGDGNPDIVIASPLADDGGRNKGAIELCFLNSDGTIREQRRISESSGGFGSGLDVRDSFGGRGISLIGDIDGDGLVDAAVGAYLDDDGGADAGAIWILFLNADFSVKSKTKISATSGNLSYPPLAGDNFGHSVAGVGDWDGNGVPDLATGANADDVGGTDAGSFSLLLLNSDATVKEQFVINATNNAFPGITIPASDRFSRTVAFMGDHRQNGTRSIAIGAGAHTTGHVWVLHFDQFAMSINSMVSGGLGSLSVAGAEAGKKAAFAWSLKGGGPSSSPWGDLALSPPYSFTPTVRANTEGIANLAANVPNGLSGVQIWFQGCELSGNGGLRLTQGTNTIIQ